MHAVATLALLLGAQSPPADPPAAAPAPVAEGGPPVPTDAEEAIESALVPRPLGHEAILGIAADLGVPVAEHEALAAIEGKYRDETAVKHGKALAEVRRRIAASTRPGAPGAGLAPVDCPERVAMLAAGLRWRQVLVQADNELLSRVASLRSEAAKACVGLVVLRRSEARDATPCDDPLAALSLASLIDAAGVDAADRRRIEDALNREWIAIARAIEQRRRLLDTLELERARLLESWGPAWRVGASPAELAARLARLEETEAGFATADEPLRRANREAAMALITLLGTTASDRVRDAADRTLWPWLFSTDARLVAAARRAGELGGAELAEHLRSLLRELDTKLAATRRDLGRRASDAEAAAEADDARPDHGSAVARLDAAVRLLEVRTKRMRAIVEACSRMSHVSAYQERAKEIFAELLASVEAEQRALGWELEGTRARLDALGAPAPDDGHGAPAADAGSPAP